MFNKYSFWLKVSIVIQYLTGIFHIIGFLTNPDPANEQEKQLFDLMKNYQFDLGVGFHRSMKNLMDSFSLSFALLLFFTATLLWYLLKNNINHHTMKGAILLSTGMYAICFIIMSLYTFLPPVVCTGLIVLTLTIALFKLSSKNNLPLKFLLKDEI